MKRKFVMLLAMTLCLCALSPCAFAAADEDELSIVVTVFSEYDWVREILGAEAENADVTLLLDSATDLHSYQPTVQDILAISTCDVFIYVGGTSDDWAEDALQQAVNEDMIVLKLLDVLGDSAVEEELAEGMQADEEESEETEYDEHVWLSLKNAQLFTAEIANALAIADPENAEVYQSNAENYIEQLSELDDQYQSVIDAASGDTLLFGDRFAFRYLTEDYGLTYYAAFSGCSAETEASFETIAFLAEKVDELGLQYVLTLEGSDQKIAQTIVSSTETKDQTILTLNAMQSVTAQDIADGVTYLSIMEENLAVLEQALN